MAKQDAGVLCRHGAVLCKSGHFPWLAKNRMVESVRKSDAQSKDLRSIERCDSNLPNAEVTLARRRMPRGELHHRAQSNVGTIRRKPDQSRRNDDTLDGISLRAWRRSRGRGWILLANTLTPLRLRFISALFDLRETWSIQVWRRSLNVLPFRPTASAGFTRLRTGNSRTLAGLNLLGRRCTLGAATAQCLGTGHSATAATFADCAMRFVAFRLHFGEDGLAFGFGQQALVQARSSDGDLLHHQGDD